MKDWIQAARLRTLPLASACVLMGAAVARGEAMTGELTRDRFHWVFAGILLTVVCLQVLSNFANDLGDAENGADDATRLDRAVASGRISPAAMRRAVIIGALLSLFLGIGSVALALIGTGLLVPAALIIGLGLASIGAAYKYTAGANPYGYRGLGDVAVFMFFGLIGVGGTAFLLAHEWHWGWLLPGAFTGAMSTAVLNLNNMRDHVKDAAAGKATLVTRLGFDRAKRYHMLLFVGGWGAFLAFFAGMEAGRWTGLMWMGLIGLVHIRHLGFVRATKEPAELDGELKKIAMSTAVVALFLLLGAINYPVR